MHIKEFVKDGFKSKNCAQIIISYFFDDESLLALSKGFGGGFGVAGLCGSYAASIGVLGLKFKDKDEFDEKVAEFKYEFINKFKNFDCKEILKADYTTKDGLEKITKHKLFETTCVDLTAYCIEILEDLIKRG